MAIARAFAAAGCKVIIADIEQDALQDALISLEGIGPDIRGVACDVGDPASIEQAAGRAISAFRNIDILSNNAGVADRSGIADISLAAWRWVVDVNLMGVVHVVRAFLPHMCARGDGHIVNTASMTGLLSDDGLGSSPYSSS